MVQFPAQVGQGLRIGRVRAEQAGDLLPGLGLPACAAKKASEGNSPRRTSAGACTCAHDGLLPQDDMQHVNVFS